jgi:Domain of unknown function (DUF4365)
VGFKVSDQGRKWRGRKRRTREHVIADLGVNYVQRLILSKGHSSEIIMHDYGVDLLMFTYNDDGEIENGHVEIQIKSTDHINILKTPSAVACKIGTAHLKAWQWEPLPVVLIVYDAAGVGRAFWLYIQNYLSDPANLIDADLNRDSITLHIPTENQLDATAIERFRGFRDRVLAQMKGVIGHDG